MLDRESTFAHPEVVALLKSRFVPVAIDQAYQRRQKDAEGEFYRKIAGQGPRSDFRQTTQGFYAASATGKLLFYNNNRNPDRLAGLLRKALNDHKIEQASPAIAEGHGAPPDRRYNPVPPQGGLVIRVRSKVLGGYEKSDDPWQKIFQSALSRDNLWVTAAEHQALVEGKVSDELKWRIARFHLVDSTRGEPAMWSGDEIESIEMSLDSEGVLSGSARMKSRDGNREFVCEFFGVIEKNDGAVTRFDLVAKGLCEGGGKYTKNPPPGKFPLAVSFSIADGSDVADKIPPQGSRGWVEGYLKCGP